MSRPVHRLVAAAALVALAACGSRRAPLIAMDAQGSITVNGEPATISGLAALPALRDRSGAVRIRVSPEVEYLHVDSLQKALQGMHVERIVFLRGK